MLLLLLLVVTILLSLSYHYCSYCNHKNYYYSYHCSALFLSSLWRSTTDALLVFLHNGDEKQPRNMRRQEMATAFAPRIIRPAERCVCVWVDVCHTHIHHSSIHLSIHPYTSIHLCIHTQPTTHIHNILTVVADRIATECRRLCGLWRHLSCMYTTYRGSDKYTTRANGHRIVSYFMCVFKKWIRMHVCMYVSIYLSIYLSIHVCMYVCMYVCMSLCIFVKIKSMMSQ